MKIDEILKGKKFKYKGRIFEIKEVHRLGYPLTIETVCEHIISFDNLEDVDFIGEPRDEEYEKLYNDMYGGKPTISIDDLIAFIFTRDIKHDVIQHKLSIRQVMIISDFITKHNL